MNKRHYEHTLPNIRGSLSNTYLFFSVIPDKDEESVGIKTIAFRFFTLFRTTVLFQKGRSLQKYRSTSE